MTDPAHSGWRIHGLALPAGMVLAGALAWYGQGRAGCGCAFPQQTCTYPLQGYMENYSREPRLASLLNRTFTDGSSIVLFGSSELTSADHPAKPVNFFNNGLGRPLFALGHAGNQSFSMHAQLIAADADLSHARLAILLSPSWFLDNSALTGTGLAAFLEYQPSPSLYSTYRRLKANDALAAPVGEYLAEHQRELGAAQPITLWLARNASATGRWLYAFSQPWNEAIIDATEDDMLYAPEPEERPIPTGSITLSVDWTALFTHATQEHLAQCTNNRAYVNDAYYAEHVNGRTRKVDVHPMEANRELRDFRGLLAFLDTLHAQPYFIIQPLNPYVYTNLAEMEPTMAAIRDELDRRGFDYLDLWTSDTTRFEPGILTDVMHLGPLGWYRVDSALATYFP